MLTLAPWKRPLGLALLSAATLVSLPVSAETPI